MPEHSESLSGGFFVESCYGDVVVGPQAMMMTAGENPGSGPIETTAENVAINGLVMNRTNHKIGSNSPPSIRIIALNGDLTIDGSNLVLDEWSFMGGKYDLTSGLMVLSRRRVDAGNIKAQAMGNITVSRDVTGLNLNRGNPAAIATKVHSNGWRGGHIRLRALTGNVSLKDRALEGEGRADNSAALIEIIADGDSRIESPSVLNSEHTPSVSTLSQTGDGSAVDGTNVLLSCDGNITIDLHSHVTAFGVSDPGDNLLTAESDGVNVNGLVARTALSHATCIDPDPIL